jgi:ubiquinone/menaquinone biosynthesis C-methylase UbiE
MSEKRHGDRGHHPGHGGGHGHFDERGRPRPGHDRHGNPEDLEAYLARLEGPDRDAWQKPDEVVAALGLRPGDVACDAGAGPGYFAIRLARAVSPGGRVHAIDVEPRMIAVLEQRARTAGVAEVVRPLLAPDGEGLPPEPCDVILVVNAFHHFPDGAGHLRRLAGLLKPDGRLVNVDFQAGDLPVGPPPDHKVSREAFLDAAARAGLEVSDERRFLPYQYLVALRRRA